ISGIGKTSSRGTLTYLSEDDIITFASPASHAIVTTIPIVPNVALASGTVPDLPTPAQFPDQGKPGQWQGSDFPTHIFSILNSRFGALWVIQSSAAIKYVSAYHRLSGLPQNVLAEVAVQIAYSPSNSRFDLYFLCRESRAKSDEW